jgi:hypothetical protein
MCKRTLLQHRRHRKKKNRIRKEKKRKRKKKGGGGVLLAELDKYNIYNLQGKEEKYLESLFTI